MRAPVAMEETIRQFFGGAATPEYSKSLEVIRHNPYLTTRNELDAKWGVDDSTDYNYDLSFVFSLERHRSNIIVRLSMVGPYALIINDSDEVVKNGAEDVVEILEQFGFYLLDHPMILSTVGIWGPKHEHTVYEYLFEFDRGCPGRRP